MIITIDGPSGTGKTTVAKKVAEKLFWSYFDTGAMYRSIAWMLLQKNISPKDKKRIQAALKEFSFDIREVNEERHYFVGETDVTHEIRKKSITSIVSEISALPFVRKSLWKLQHAYAEKQNAVFEGRDMGSVVFPKAEVKIFLDALPEIRAKRRLKEYREKYPHEVKALDEQSMEEELRRRDDFDASREFAPLKVPNGAHVINTSHMNIDMVVEEILKIHHKTMEKKLVPGWLRSKKMHFLYRLVLCISWYGFRIFYRHKIYGLEHYVTTSAIIAPNHTSYFDPPIIAISWPSEVHFLARKSLFRPFLFGRFIRALNSHPVQGDVADISVFKTILKLLEDGKQVVLFPEGGRSDGKLGAIKPGIGMLLQRSESQIIPTFIYGANKIWERDRKLPRLWGKTACVFGSAMKWSSFAHLEKKEAQKAIAEELSHRIRGLKQWYDKGAKGIPP